MSWLDSAAASGASALVAAAAGDLWQLTRTGLVALFRFGGGRRQELAARWADETAAEIEQTPAEERDEVRQRLAPTWARRLADLIDEYPEAGDELRAWAEHVRAQLPAPQQTWVHTYVARDHSHQYNAPHGNLTVNHVQGPGTTPAS